MPIADVLYRTLTNGARAVAPAVARVVALASSGDSKLVRTLEARRTAAAHLVAWAQAGRDRSRPLVWVHAPSVGEGLQARAVIDALRPLRSDVQVAFTHTSPSAEALARGLDVDVAGYLPWDTRDEMRRVLDALDPSLVVFAKTEVWPVLAAEARARGIATALLGAILPPTSGRTSPLVRAVLTPAYAALDRVLAVGADDAAALVRLGVRAEALTVTGDPAVDSAAARVAAVDPDAAWLAPFHADPAATLVAGSTWPTDEAVLAPALARLPTGSHLRLIIAPHEPDPAHVAALTRRLEQTGRQVATLAEVEARGAVAPADTVIVDRVGVLAALYTAGSMAYVGGGFHDAGLHSVLEPAAAGLPVVFGPGHRNAAAAGELLTVGGAVEVPDAPALTATLGIWLGDDTAHRAAAKASSSYIERHRGAAHRTAVSLEALLPPAPDPRR